MADSIKFNLYSLPRHRVNEIIECLVSFLVSNTTVLPDDDMYGEGGRQLFIKTCQLFLAVSFDLDGVN